MPGIVGIISRKPAAECERISGSATDSAKRDLFAKLAEHHRILAAEVERAIEAALAVKH